MTEPSTPATRADWVAAWTHARSLGGWMTADQGRALWQAAHAVPAGQVILEIGSHQGRSTVVLATAARANSARVVAIDPFVEGRLFGGTATRDVFEANLTQAGVRDAVELRVAKSTVLRPGWAEPLALLYIDGKHDYWTVRDDLLWSRHVADGGSVFVHDCFSSIGVTAAVLLHVLPGRQLRYVERTGSLARFTVARPAPTDRLRILAQLPWFARNVVIKIALRVARLFGSTRPDPY